MKFIIIPRVYILIFLILSLNSIAFSNRLTSSNPLYRKKGLGNKILFIRIFEINYQNFSKIEKFYKILFKK